MLRYWRRISISLGETFCRGFPFTLAICLPSSTRTKRLNRLLPSGLSQLFQQLPQVGRQRHVPVHAFPGYRMFKAKLGGMQSQTRRSAWIGLRFRSRFAIDLFAAHWMAQLGKMDANLVRAARLKPA